MRKILFLVTLVLFLHNCSDDDSPLPNNCQNIACTEIFISFHVSVKDSDDEAVALDQFKVTDVNSGEDLTRLFDEATLAMFKAEGRYPLYDDLYLQGHENTTREIRFMGTINDEEVVNETYVVAADCCHVSLVSGNLSPVIN
ncbi:hypothetical protein [Spongiimicrobium sp. 3-5]|uniref:hypothetical protein n=1 Tax=Spongiimicrobium sp. 3-5 TaxID=3332596 RepID=UPI00397FE1CF